MRISLREAHERQVLGLIAGLSNTRAPNYFPNESLSTTFLATITTTFFKIYTRSLFEAQKRGVFELI
jgi:hypothetical protein